MTSLHRATDASHNRVNHQLFSRHDKVVTLLNDQQPSERGIGTIPCRVRIHDFDLSIDGERARFGFLNFCFRRFRALVPWYAFVLCHIRPLLSWAHHSIRGKSMLPNLIRLGIQVSGMDVGIFVELL